MTDAPTQDGSGQPESDGDGRAQASAAADAIAALADAPALIAADRIAGDLLDAVLREIQSHEQPWHLLNMGKQAKTIEAIRARVRAAVESACVQIAARDYPVIEMRCKQISIGKQVTASLVCDHDADGLDFLAKSVDSRLCVVDVDAEEFMDGFYDAQPKPDQEEMELPNGEENGEEEDDESGEDDGDDGEE